MLKELAKEHVQRFRMRYLVNVHDVISSAHGGTVTVARVVVATVEFIHDQRCSITAQILDLCQLRVLHHLTCRVARVGGQDDRSTARNLIRNLLRMDMIAICFGQGRGYRSEVPEQAKHLIVGRVIGNEEAQIGIVQDSRNADEPRSAARDDGDVLPRVLAVFALTMVFVVQVGDGGSQWLYTCRRTILSASHRHVDGLGAFKASFNVIVDLS